MDVLRVVAGIVVMLVLPAAEVYLIFQARPYAREIPQRVAQSR